MEGEISKKFFGMSADVTFEKVLITNVGPIFDAILRKAEVVSQDNGFYHSSLVRLRGGSWRIIKITPGNVIVDVLKAVRPWARRIVLVGIVGCLNDSFKAGDVISPAESVIADDIEKPIKFCNEDVTYGRICQTDGLIQSQDFYLKLIRAGVDFVDMESYYLAKFASENEKSSKFIGVISDNPLTDPFYKTQYRYWKMNIDSVIANI